MHTISRVALAAFVLIVAVTSAQEAPTPRARDLGVPFDGMPGPLNAITDVNGVEVGHTTLIRGNGTRTVGQGPVRTGVTAIWPRGKGTPDPVFAAWFSLNGFGEMTGTTSIQERGLLNGPVMITNTLSVGIVHHAVIRWGVAKALEAGGGGWLAPLPVVAETADGLLNDSRGQHVTEDDALAAMDSAVGGSVAEGNVGGGTGMICMGFKGGIGTASRRVEVKGITYTVGALVQCNFGSRSQLRIAGVPVGREISDLMPARPDAGDAADRLDAPRGNPVAADLLRQDERDGSIIVVVATDAPLLPHQLKRVARRISLGLARTGSISGNSSGDIFIAFSTANRGWRPSAQSEIARVDMLPHWRLDPLFAATVEATEEAIVNATVAAETMTGADDWTVYALPHDRLREVLRNYNRLE